MRDSEHRGRRKSNEAYVGIRLTDHETQKGGLRARRTKLTNVDLLCRIGAASLNSGGVSVVC